ncbi:MAG TPA: polyprenyl diphosphate synthase [Pseudonocardiaceae bacterium]|jgi:short-chain Z-isoprenyl diphosphate synthase|nr:polyprenyl diphosphate synthase [Pseudonocardiaceae bacterium]
MTIRQRMDALYVRRLQSRLAGQSIPRHVGVIMDGNRRWARQMGFADPSIGHRYGAEHVERVLDWCAESGVSHVTIFLVSTENLISRPSPEIQFLMRVIEEVIGARLARPESGWQVHLAGLLDLLPDSTARVLKQAKEATQDVTTGRHITIAAGYGGRQEVVDAVRSLLEEGARTGATLAQLAETVTVDEIAANLYTSGLPDPDLIIRTSGEQRMSNFLLWQSAYSELYFCDAYWPGFRQIDFLRALRSYAVRKRRFGG